MYIRLGLITVWTACILTKTGHSRLSSILTQGRSSLFGARQLLLSSLLVSFYGLHKQLRRHAIPTILNILKRWLGWIWKVKEGMKAKWKNCSTPVAPPPVPPSPRMQLFLSQWFASLENSKQVVFLPLCPSMKANHLLILKSSFPVSTLCIDYTTIHWQIVAPMPTPTHSTKITHFLLPHHTFITTKFTIILNSLSFEILITIAP